VPGLRHWLTGVGKDGQQQKEANMEQASHGWSGGLKLLLSYSVDLLSKQRVCMQGWRDKLTMPLIEPLNARRTKMWCQRNFEVKYKLTKLLFSVLYTFKRFFLGGLGL